MSCGVDKQWSIHLNIAVASQEIRIIDILLTADISNIKTIVIDKVTQDVGMSDVSTLLISVVYEAFVH